MKSLLPLNAFSGLTVRGLVFDNDATLDQKFHRGIVKPGEQIFMDFDDLKRQGGMPARPKSLLPPPGNMHLKISLGKKLGLGRAGTVYTVNVLSPNHINLPPLVIKISNPKRSINMAQEAWFYEELEQLQGVAVARCYGFFQARLEEGRNVLTWDKYDCLDDGSEHSNEQAECPDPEYVDNLIPLDPADYNSEFNICEPPNPKKECEDYEKAILGQGQILSILLFERLGSHMPIGEPIGSIQDEVYELFDDLARLGIEPLDIRYDNILSVREGDTSSVVCPNHAYIHKWRLLDFDVARKIDATTAIINGGTGSWLRRLFRNLVEGYIIEPHDL